MFNKVNNNSPLPITKIGDTGNTLLSDYKEIKKSSKRISAIGDIDELNSTIGVTIGNLYRYNNIDDYKNQQKRLKEVKNILKEVQQVLFIAGADCSTPIENDTQFRVKEKHHLKIESLVNKYHQMVTPLENFILPNGELHWCRSIARRAERSLWKLNETEAINKNLLIYFNRLSDLFFTFARYISKDEKWNHRS